MADRLRGTPPIERRQWRPMARIAPSNHAEGHTWPSMAPANTKRTAVIADAQSQYNHSCVHSKRQLPSRQTWEGPCAHRQCSPCRCATNPSNSLDTISPVTPLSENAGTSGQAKHPSQRPPAQHRRFAQVHKHHACQLELVVVHTPSRSCQLLHCPKADL
jgi:hypothetical protein